MCTFTFKISNELLEMFITVEKRECEKQEFTYQFCLNICRAFDDPKLNSNPVFLCSFIQLSKLFRPKSSEILSC